MNEEVAKVLREGLDAGTRRYVGKLMQNYLTDPKTLENFARGLERAADAYEKAVAVLDEMAEGA